MNTGPAPSLLDEREITWAGSDAHMDAYLALLRTKLMIWFRPRSGETSCVSFVFQVCVQKCDDAHASGYFVAFVFESKCDSSCMAFEQWLAVRNFGRFCCVVECSRHSRCIMTFNSFCKSR
jgi:hypothetical protein